MQWVSTLIRILLNTFYGKKDLEAFRLCAIKFCNFCVPRIVSRYVWRVCVYECVCVSERQTEREIMPQICSLHTQVPVTSYTCAHTH